MDYVYLALVLASLLIYSQLPFFWLLRHMLKLRYGSWLALDIILILTFAMAAVVLYAIFSSFIYVKSELPPYSGAFGWLLIAAALATEAWSLYLLGRKIKAQKGALIISGPYAVVRHPIYLSHTIANFGIYLVTGALIPLFVFAEWLVLIKPLVDVEDEELALRFGEEFLEYKEKVPQLIPKLQK